ncbi:sulfate ABC transporter, ATP-binding protein [Oceanicola granulosus HTCC2516]|uniref:Sulfate ABC transporter, ATP-binding protein n=1 Tax=Oceanicola granulosus (strain ATCC BAA-861 / DSM 15982 / KCTC 12143 / HTCC2516) TaxID=314256 RepID=Q2CGK8_OCEGH|nr:ABC transporter ATP-binding protein [Oceanicola granulosus]EAR51710.1 sulfate ABC transporter, ATP-binding protein [Oceanicola granulosus HTCC2516]
MLELRRVTKAFAGVPAIDAVDLTIHDDEYLTLLGPSGSGKSTLLRLIAGLEVCDSGTISLDGEDITYSPTHLRNLGFVQQSYGLFPHMNVFDNVAFGLRHRTHNPIEDSSEVDRRVKAMLDLVGLSELGQRMVGQLSGGQKQRVSLARTLVTEPKVCLLDEPLGALDANLRERMTVELRKIREALGVTFMHVTGNEDEALAMGDRMIVLDHGRLLQVAPPDMVYREPDNVAVARFVNAYNILEGRVSDGAFLQDDARLPAAGAPDGKGYYAIRHDAATIHHGSEPPEGAVALPATFVTEEFLGSRFFYFLRLDDGTVFEVERHLSREDPIHLEAGTRCMVSWDPRNALHFGADGNRIGAPAMKGAA